MTLKTMHIKRKRIILIPYSLDICIYISPIYPIQILSRFKTNYFFSLNSGFNQVIKKECKYINKTLQLKICKYLYFNPNANLDANSLLLPLQPVAKSFKLKKCQLITTYYQTINEKYDINSGVYTDQMGLGKTVTTIFAHLLNRLIVIN